MRTAFLTIGLFVPLLGVSTAFSQEPDTSVSAKRQLVMCMTKSMSASRTLSYNDAQRDCKERLVTQNQAALAKRPLAANAVDSPTLKNP